MESWSSSVGGRQCSWCVGNNSQPKADRRPSSIAGSSASRCRQCGRSSGVPVSIPGNDGPSFGGTSAARRLLSGQHQQSVASYFFLGPWSPTQYAAWFTHCIVYFQPYQLHFGYAASIVVACILFLFKNFFWCRECLSSSPSFMIEINDSWGDFMIYQPKKRPDCWRRGGRLAWLCFLAASIQELPALSSAREICWTPGWITTQRCHTTSFRL